MRAENITLGQAVVQSGHVKPENFDRRAIRVTMTVLKATLPGGGD